MISLQPWHVATYYATPMKMTMIAFFFNKEWKQANQLQPHGSRTGAKTIKTNSTQHKSQTQRGRVYEVTEFLSTDCELGTADMLKPVDCPVPRFHVSQFDANWRYFKST